MLVSPLNEYSMTTFFLGFLMLKRTFSISGTSDGPGCSIESASSQQQSLQQQQAQQLSQQSPIPISGPQGPVLQGLTLKLFLI